MPRPKRTDGRKPVTLFKTGNYRYAVTQETVKSPKTGRYTHPKTIWGSVDHNLVFTPNARYLTLDEKDRAALLFPEDWNVQSLPPSVNKKPGRPSYTGESVSQLYGAVMLFEEISRSCGLTEDLIHIFGEEKAVDITA